MKISISLRLIHLHFQTRQKSLISFSKLRNVILVSACLRLHSKIMEALFMKEQPLGVVFIVNYVF